MYVPPPPFFTLVPIKLKLTVCNQVLDVDIFGEEMQSPDNYADISRLASVGIVLRRIA